MGAYAILFSSVTVCLCCVRVLCFSMYLQKVLCLCPHGVQRGMVGMLLFLRGCGTIVLYCVMFLSLQNI